VIELPWYPTQRQLRQFAWVSPLGFVLVGWVVWRATGSREAWIALAALGVLSRSPDSRVRASCGRSTCSRS
jgi:hypothetical protein